MKKSVLITASLLLSISLQAQITLNSTNAPSLTVCQSDDSLTRPKLSGTLPDMSAKANGTWDLTTIVDSQYLFTYSGVASSSAFPTATFTHDIGYAFSALKYIVVRMYSITSGGIIAHGEHLDRQALSIGAQTGDSGDSLVFALQDINYTPTRIYTKYPSTMSTTWTEVYNYNTAFNLTVALYSLNKTPGERRSKHTVKNTVVGWGKMSVKDKDGNPSGYMDVLQIEVERSLEDSFYLGGSLAPTALLTAFGLTQGQVSTSVFRNYMRIGEVTPLAEVQYTDNTYNTIQDFRIHRQRLPKPVGIKNISVQNISIYPNPVVNNNFTVKMDGVNGNISYELYSITGQSVAAGNVPASGSVNLQSSIPSGTYFIKLKTDDGMYGVKQVNIIN